MRQEHPRKGHTGQTEKGHTRDAKVERLGNVTIYKRGRTYYLYYREKNKSIRQRVEGNLNSARAAASSTNQSLEEDRPSPFGYKHISVDRLVDEYIDYAEKVQRLAVRSVDRYRAALSHFTEFSRTRGGISTTAHVDQGIVEDFIKWMRALTRTRNGSQKGPQRPYRAGGIAFILSTCRTAFNWARKRHYLPPYAENPFSTVQIDKIGRDDGNKPQILSVEEQQAFFKICDAWQKPVFFMLAAYGLRVGELTHLLISDINFEEGVFHIRSKPEMFWNVKTRDERALPILPEIKEMLLRCVGGRKEGFVFVNRESVEGKERETERFASAQAFSNHLRAMADQARAEGAVNEKEVMRKMLPFLRGIGQIPEKRIRQEFMKLTKKIGRPDLTKAHSLRHLFSTRAQEQGMNPILVQSILGHASLDMTQRYTHFGMEAKRQAVSQMLRADPVLSVVVQKSAS